MQNEKLIKKLCEEHLFRCIIELETTISFLFEITDQDKDSLCVKLHELRKVYEKWTDND